MAQNKFRLYPRGFLGDGNNTPVSHRYDASAVTMRVLRNADTSPTQFKMLGAPNQELDGMYQSLTTTPATMEIFAWRETFLATALKAFGTTSLMEWTAIQASSPYCGKHHKNFIKDCMRFTNGIARTQAISTWNNLISDEDLSKDSSLPVEADGFLFCGNRLSQATIADLIRAWCSQDNGYGDMAISLNILFGRYDGSTDS